MRCGSAPLNRDGSSTRQPGRPPGPGVAAGPGLRAAASIRVTGSLRVALQDRLQAAAVTPGLGRPPQRRRHWHCPGAPGLTVRPGRRAAAAARHGGAGAGRTTMIKFDGRQSWAQAKFD
jgi:hypothetical protein